MNIIKKVFVILYRKYVKVYKIFGPQFYQRRYRKWMIFAGIQLPEKKPGYIADDVKFDYTNTNILTIENDVVISTGVVLLVHDFAPSHLNESLKPIIKPIFLKKSCFIGANSILLPGTLIGERTIVGAGSVVKGEFPNDVVIAGNPAKVICSIDDYVAKREKVS